MVSTTKNLRMIYGRTKAPTDTQSIPIIEQFIAAGQKSLMAAAVVPRAVR